MRDSDSDSDSDRQEERERQEMGDGREEVQATQFDRGFGTMYSVRWALGSGHSTPGTVPLIYSYA